MVRCLSPDDAEYPASVASLPRPPRLWIRGSTLVPGGTRVVAIVGTRDASPRTCRHARRLAAACAEAGIVVASGGARGVDAAAHKGTLRAKGRTWCVLGTGCEHVFPPENADLFEAIARRGGALVWPFRPGMGPRPGNFTARNRVLVALAHAVVVVAARWPKSGALNAANHARRLGREVWAVPGAPYGEGAGTYRLVEDGEAEPLVDVGAFIDRVLGGPGRSPGPSVSARAPRPLDGAAEQVVKALENAPAHPEAVVSRTGLPPDRAATALLTLVLAGVLVEGSDGLFRVVR